MYITLHHACCALRAIKLRDSKNLKQAVEATLQLLFDDYSSLKVPSAATMSRARRKVDVAMMYLRRSELEATGIAESSIQLSFLIQI